MKRLIKIGTRESQLAVWQANEVKHLLEAHGYASELVFIKSEGDIDLVTPLYEIGVQGIFTKTLDMALLAGRIDIAVHSMKDVPTILAKGTAQAAVLKRGSYKDILVPKDNFDPGNAHENAVIATSSIRRRAQWLNRYPGDSIETLRGNVNTRLQKLANEKWNGAIFAAAGLERINLRPANAIDLDWMLPAPAQGAIMVACREGDSLCLDACAHFNDADTALCTKIERDFLRALLGGCSTPISALATITGNEVMFKGNMLTRDGRQKATVTRSATIDTAGNLGETAAAEILQNGGQEIMKEIRNAQ
jgi:hydroxymethylbilane synthase